MKAWKVQIIDGNYDDTDIVWANTREQARYNSFLYFETDYTNLSAVRVPKLDDLELAATDKDYWNAGFVVRCSKCDKYACEPSFDSKGNCYCEDCDNG